MVVLDTEKDIKNLKFHLMVKQYRLQHGLRQEDLAAGVDVSRRTIVNAETDNCNLSLSIALRLATYFEKSVDELFVKEDAINIYNIRR